MSSFHQLPHVSGARPQPMSSGRIMAWLTFAFMMAWPRLVLLAFWIFGNTLGGAFDGWVVPAIGFLVLPWTTMAYALAWGLSSNTVSGMEYGIVAVALIADALTWIGARALR
jgi:hypothetical protein